MIFDQVLIAEMNLTTWGPFYTCFLLLLQFTYKKTFSPSLKGYIFVYQYLCFIDLIFLASAVWKVKNIIREFHIRHIWCKITTLIISIDELLNLFSYLALYQHLEENCLWILLHHRESSLLILVCDLYMLILPTIFTFQFFMMEFVILAKFKLL